MAKYLVIVVQYNTQYASIEVEADSTQKAIDRTYELAGEGDIDWETGESDFEIEEVDVIDEE